MDSGAAHVLLLLAAIIVAAFALFYLKRGAPVGPKPIEERPETPPMAPRAPPPDAPGSRTPAVWRAAERQSFDLDCSVFAPEVVDGRAEFAIQAILHEADAEAAAETLAARLDPDASVRARARRSKPRSPRETYWSFVS